MKFIDPEVFCFLLEQLRQQDEVATTQFVQMVQPSLCFRIQSFLTNSALRRITDPMDIFQDVIIKFLEGIQSDKFELTHPAQVYQLLLTMARNEVLRQTKSLYSQKNYCPLVSDRFDFLAALLPDPKADVVSNVIRRELWQRTQALMTLQDQQIAGLRLQGYSWEHIGANFGMGGEAIRKRFERSMARIARSLRVEEVHND